MRALMQVEEMDRTKEGEDPKATDDEAPNKRSYYKTKREMGDARPGPEPYSTAPCPRANTTSTLSERYRQSARGVREEDLSALSLFVSQAEAARLLGVTRAAISFRVNATRTIHSYEFCGQRWVWLPDVIRHSHPNFASLSDRCRGEQIRITHGLTNDERQETADSFREAADWWGADPHLRARAEAMIWAVMLRTDPVAIMRETGLEYHFVIETIDLMIQNQIVIWTDEGEFGVHSEWLDEKYGDASFWLDALVLEGIVTFNPEEAANKIEESSTPQERKPAEEPKASSTPEPPPAQPQTEADSEREGRPPGIPIYNRTTLYTQKNKLWHPQYGAGTVLCVRENKIDVMFEDRERTLIHGMPEKSESSD